MVEECNDGSLSDALTCGNASIREMAVQIFDAAHGVPPKVQTIMALKSFGLSNAEIARRLGYRDARWITKLLDRWDPDRITERGDMVRRLVLCNMAERVAFECLSRIRESDFDELTLKDKMAIVKDAVKVVEELKAKAVTLDPKEEKLIEDIRSWAQERGDEREEGAGTRDDKGDGDVGGGGEERGDERLSGAGGCTE